MKFIQASLRKGRDLQLFTLPNVAGGSTMKDAKPCKVILFTIDRGKNKLPNPEHLLFSGSILPSSQLLCSWTVVMLVYFPFSSTLLYILDVSIRLIYYFNHVISQLKNINYSPYPIQ